MRRIGHRVRCSGVMHEIWRDTSGVLHRTCDGEGCTLGFEKARALLSGLPDIPVGTGWRARYAACKWGEDWQDAKRAGWRKRKERHHARDEALLSGSDRLLELIVDAEFDEVLPRPFGKLSDAVIKAFAEDETKKAILARLTRAISADLHRVTYRRPSVSSSHHGTAAGSILAFARVDNSVRAALVSVEVEPVKIRLPSGLPRTIRQCRLFLASTPEQAFRVRTALGGSSLFHSGTNTFVAAAILEARADGFVVVAGKQGRGLLVDSAPALVRREGERAVLTRWLEWSELDGVCVAPYAAALEAHGTCSQIHWVQCIRAVSGRPEFVECVQNALVGDGHAWFAARAYEAEVRSSLAAMSPWEDLYRDMERCRSAARDYAAWWGDLVGCLKAKTCVVFSVFAGFVDGPQSFLVCRSGCRLFPHTDLCPIAKPVVDALSAVSEYYRVQGQIKHAIDERRRVEKNLRRCGFRMTAEGRLVEIGGKRKTRTGDGKQKRGTRGTVTRGAVTAG